MATHSSVLAWRIPGTGEPGGLPSMGSHRVGLCDLSDLAAAAAAESFVYLAPSMSTFSYSSSPHVACPPKAFALIIRQLFQSLRKKSQNADPFVGLVAGVSAASFVLPSTSAQTPSSPSPLLSPLRTLSVGTPHSW